MQKWCSTYSNLLILILLIPNWNNILKTLTKIRCGSTQLPTSIPREEPTLWSSWVVNSNNNPKIHPLPIIIKLMQNIATKKDIPYWDLGTRVIGPFLRKRVTPNTEEQTLNVNDAVNWRSCPKCEMPQFNSLQPEDSKYACPSLPITLFPIPDK